MQKFVKLNTGTGLGPLPVPEKTTLHPSQVKLVGYLKKKRTKVGGWRKMWFVLQNQLLLSYPSKEDYDKKLVSFKDVLNLVPGTIVRPLGSYRFAIQTTSESVYIFRCDDNKTYMEWITALVDSLSIGSSSSKKKDMMPKKPLHGSHSCSSLIRSKKNKAVHIPIAHGTARILNRTGLSENDLRAFSSNGCSFHDTSERANYFCLHDNQLLLQTQSNAISRINRMFCGSASDVELSSSIHAAATAATAAGASKSGLTQQAMTTTTTLGKSSRFKGLQCDAGSDGEYSGSKSVINRKMHELLSLMKTENLKMVVDDDKVHECEVSKDVNANRSYVLEKFFDCESSEVCDRQKCLEKNNDEGAAPDVERNATVEDQIQRLSLRGSSGFTVKDNKITTADQEVSYLRLSSATRADEGSPFLRHRRISHEQGCSSSSSAESCLSAERRAEDCSEVGDEAKRDEPIYAVVDLKNKYEHRARLRHELEEQRRTHGRYLKSLDEVTTDYEEVMNYPEDESKDSYTYDDENIYEPINIPEVSYNPNKHRNILWKYISRINIDALIEMARSRKKNPKSTEQNSPFANIKQKFGHHRKSIRIRMIKLYTREHPAEESHEKSDTADSKPDEA